MQPWKSLMGMTLTCAALPAVAAPPASPVSGPVARAVSATTARTPDNVKLDESRKPVALLKFLGLRPGMAVLDLFGANRYWSEIIAPAIGPKGRVTVWQPTQFMNEKRAGEFAAFARRQPNVAIISSPFEGPNFPANRFDFAIMNLDYHDLYWENAKNGIVRQEPSKWLSTLYAAMKPGAVVGIVDHAGPAGDTRAIVEKLHRIDPAVVRADMKAAGFRLEATSELLRNRADDHSLNVFDEKIRGRTDRFVMKFRKPAR